MSICITILTHFLSERRNKNQRYAEAGAEFRNAFLSAKIEIGKCQCDVFKIMRPHVLDLHREAKEKFKGFLSEKNQKKLDVAWMEYEHSAWTKSPGSLDNRPGECKAAIDKIEHLMSFAKV